MVVVETKVVVERSVEAKVVVAMVVVARVCGAIAPHTAAQGIIVKLVRVVEGTGDRGDDQKQKLDVHFGGLIAAVSPCCFRRWGSESLTQTAR